MKTTTYILHGGENSRQVSSNEQFWKQLTNLVEGDAANVLICPWARKMSEWQRIYDRDSEQIKLHSNKKHLTINLMKSSEDLTKKNNFYQVVFMVGGEQEFLEPYVSKLNQIKDHFEGKVIAGSSMGAFMIGAHYILSADGQSKDTIVRKGLGLLPTNVLCHWNIEPIKNEKLTALRKASDFPILTLNECEFVTFYK